GFTLVEVVVSMVVFGLVIVGLSSVFVSGGKLIMHNRERMTSAQLGKFFLDPLQADVRQDTWNSGSLKVSDTPVSLTTQKINNRDFSATYKVADGITAPIDPALTGTDLRRVTATIIWDEHSS
ncbi:MAG: prepilin-type N-terminal cleavage/methylation domain-containing protein, partial [Candidatus Omnitrophota bacterium]|nr:prepilin-type N-terminal cleavage/methylation domain-containing protein [Candidatus Omnitrophota bacterium]